MKRSEINKALKELEKMIAPSSYTGICSVLARELADKAEAKAKMMTEK